MHSVSISQVADVNGCPRLPEAKLRERLLSLAHFAEDESQATQTSRAACFTRVAALGESHGKPRSCSVEIKKHSLLAVSHAALQHPSVAGRSLGRWCMGHGHNIYLFSSFPMRFLLRLLQEGSAVSKQISQPQSNACNTHGQAASDARLFRSRALHVWSAQVPKKLRLQRLQEASLPCWCEDLKPGAGEAGPRASKVSRHRELDSSYLHR